VASVAFENVNELLLIWISDFSRNPLETTFELQLFHREKDDGSLVVVVSVGYHVGDDSAGPLKIENKSM
jgi:hypothetical protein